MSNADPGAISPWKDGFLFLGNQPALDFVNTRPVQNDQPMELLTDFGALVRWFHAAELISSESAARLQRQWERSANAQQTFDAMLEFREKLRKGVLALEHGDPIPHSTIDELNHLLDKYPMRTRLKADARKIHASLEFQANAPDALFAPLAHHAAELFSQVDHVRIRQCDSCVLHFHDTSKKGTRRWCSMQLCGNRLKVAAYAKRQRRLTRKAQKT